MMSPAMSVVLTIFFAWIGIGALGWSIWAVRSCFRTGDMLLLLIPYALGAVGVLSVALAIVRPWVAPL